MPTMTKGGARVTQAPAWYTQILDSLAAAQRSYSPEIAMEVVQVMEYLPDLHQEIAKFYTALGNKSVDMVELPPSTETFFRELGAQMQKQHGALVSAMATARKSVQDRIDRVLQNNHRVIAWDVEKNNKQRTW